jgi:L,D-transpeptidase-like protein
VRTDLYAASPARLIGALGGALIATFIAAGLFGSAAPATAQDGFGNGFGYQSQQRYKHRSVQRSRGPSSDDQAANKSSDKKGKKEEAKKSAPQGAVYAVISLADQHVTIYDATGRIAQSRISTGMPGHPTPIGLFSIIGKERWHHSNIYSGAPMPFMQRITWSGVAMHLGVVPGYPASHGCIRLPAEFAQQLWGMTQLGNRVVVARRDTSPFEISSAFLPVPKMQPAPNVLPGSQQAAAPASAPVKVASIGNAAPVTVSATTSPQDTAATAATAPKLLNPIEYAKALKERALASKTAADQAAKDALAAAQAVGAEARQAVDDVSKADADLKAAEAELAALDAQASAAVTAAAQRPVTPPVTTQAVPTQPTATAPATAPDAATEATAAAGVAAAASARAAAQGDIDRARAALTEAQSREAAKTPAAFAAVQAWKAAIATGDLAAETVKESDRRLEPVSILFSKKEGRVFIRQDWKEVYEAPITFKDPDRAIGTHLFVAVDADADGKVKWSAISVPSGGMPSDDAPRNRSKNDKSAEPAPAPTPQADTAAAALERVELPDGVRERMAELVWTGAQVIVTDNARSDEMDIDTDIIVSTR